MFKIPLFDLSSVFYTSCTKKEPYLFIGKTHKFKNCLNLMTLDLKYILIIVLTIVSFVLGILGLVLVEYPIMLTLHRTVSIVLIILLAIHIYIFHRRLAVA